MTLLVLLAVVSAVVTFGLSLAVYRLSLKFRLVPAIRARDVHTRPTPRLGGVAMFLGIVVAFLVAYLLTPKFPVLLVVFADPGPVLAILGGALLVVIVGVIDDIWDLDWMTKLAGQFVAAGLVAWLGVQLYSLPIGDTSTVGSSWMSLVITVFAVVLVMNAINFVDGLDGLVAGVALIANGTFVVYSYSLWRATSPQNYFSLASVIAAILVGACAGFLPLNWHPAKLFMGDSGAMLIGLLMATSAIAITGSMEPSTVEALGRSDLLPAFIPIILPFAILIVPLADFGMAVIRRLAAGKSPFSADRKHLHHRLLDMGHSQLHAVLIFYGWAAVVSLGCLFFFVFDQWFAITFLGVGVLVCLAVTLAPLGRRKAAETRAQLAQCGAPGALDEARSDPLDRRFQDTVAIPGRAHDLSHPAPDAPPATLEEHT